MTEVTHVNCGGTLIFERRDVPVTRRERTLVNGRWIPADDPTCTVLVCQRCRSVISSQRELRPLGAVCGASA
jgi:hypothetical protein